MVSTGRSKKPVRRAHRRVIAVAAPEAVLPPSLPPEGIAPDAVVSASSPIASDPSADTPAKKPFWDVGKESIQYEKAMKCLAMRLAGIDTKEIAVALGCTQQTVWNLCYMAGKNGWADTFATAKDQIEFAIMPKVVRNLEASLDDHVRHMTSGMPVSTQVALAIAQGMVFERGGDTSGVQGTSTAIAIRIEMPAGLALPVREGTISGVPAYGPGTPVYDGEVTPKP